MVAMSFDSPFPIVNELAKTVIHAHSNNNNAETGSTNSTILCSLTQFTINASIYNREMNYIAVFC